MISRFRIFFLILFMGATLPAHAAEPDSTSAEPDTTEAATLTEFENGLQLLVLPRPDESLVEVDTYLSLRGAGRNAGMAHLVEHLMFTSTENCPGGSVRDSLALLATYHQGSTNPRHVHIKTRCLPELLPRLLAVEAERFGRLAPDAADLAHEKHRVLGEQDYRSDNLGLRVIAMAYAEDEGGDPLIGTPQTISGIGLAEVDTFITRWMRPDRMVVMVSGPVEPDSVAVLARATLGRIEPHGEDPAIGELPPATEARSFVSRNEEDYDLLAVGFRLPYRTPEDAALVHLTETIMKREDGHPHLSLFEDEALLIIHVPGAWSAHVSDEEGAQLALDQFWEETRIVTRRVGDTWLFNRNRKAHVEDFKKRLSEPYRRTTWRAQLLAEDRDLPSPEVLATMVDSLSQDWVQGFFADYFVPERAFTAFAAGRAPDHEIEADWNRMRLFEINPYLVPTAKALGLGREEIAPVLEVASLAGVGHSTEIALRNGIPVHVLPLQDTKKTYLGGVRTFPCLEDEAWSESKGRLFLYRLVINYGYDRKGSRIHPTGKDAGGNAMVQADASTFMITGSGKARDFKRVTQHLHKRVNVDHLNPYVFEYFVKHRNDQKRHQEKFEAFQARMWRIRTVFGKDHPMVGALSPDFDRMTKLSSGKMNQLHKQLAKTGNFRMVVTGNVDEGMVQEMFDPTFGKRAKAEPGRYPVAARSDLGVEGKVFHDENTEVATFKALFPPRPLGENLEPLDLRVAARLIETRLRIAMETSGLDSVMTKAWVDAAGEAAMGGILAVSRPVDADSVQALVTGELERLKTQPPDEDEEARARMQVLGPLVEGMLDGAWARYLLLEFATFGDVPADPMGQLWSREYGVVSNLVSEVFPADRYAWTLVKNDPPQEDLDSD